MGQKNNIPEVFLTRKAKNKSRKSPIPYYIVLFVQNKVTSENIDRKSMVAMPILELLELL